MVSFTTLALIKPTPSPTSRHWGLFLKLKRTEVQGDSLHLSRVKIKHVGAILPLLYVYMA
jgi:hypothetical protein